VQVYQYCGALASVLLLAVTNGLCASLTLIKGQRLVLPGRQVLSLLALMVQNVKY
jgi:hypothetical protein